MARTGWETPACAHWCPRFRRSGADHAIHRTFALSRLRVNPMILGRSTNPCDSREDAKARRERDVGRAVLGKSPQPSASPHDRARSPKEKGRTFRPAPILVPDPRGSEYAILFVADEAHLGDFGLLDDRKYLIDRVVTGPGRRARSAARARAPSPWSVRDRWRSCARSIGAPFQVIVPAGSIITLFFSGSTLLGLLIRNRQDRSSPRASGPGW
jgi:hypothetical protein